MNVRGATDANKRRAIFDKYKHMVDLLILQETHSDPNCEDIWRNEWGGNSMVLFSHGTTAARGIAIFVAGKFKDCVQNIYKDTLGRTIMVDIVENNQTITLAVIYAPNDNSPDYFANLRMIMRDQSEHKIIIGDFNCVLDVNLDRFNNYCNNNRAKDEILDIAEEFSMSDIWRVQNGERREYSWFKTGDLTKASRIILPWYLVGLIKKLKRLRILLALKLIIGHYICMLK